MKCGDKEWKHCRVEKMGCNGCYYDEKTNTILSKEELAIFNTNNWYECSGLYGGKKAKEEAIINFYMLKK